MKKGFSFVVLLIICGILLSFINHNSNSDLALGSPIPLPNQKLKDTFGKEVTLESLATTQGLLVIFSANACPYVKMYATRIKELTDYCAVNKIGCVLINSNESQRNEDDSVEEMIKFSSEYQIKCSHIIDDASKMADAFGATKTPQCFLFNQKALIYKGTIDDNIRDANEVKQHYLKAAIDALIKNKTPEIPETKAIGCSIKRLE